MDLVAAWLASMNSLKLVSSDREKYLDTEKTHRETLALDKKMSRKKLSNMLTSINNLGIALSDQGKYVEAE